MPLPNERRQIDSWRPAGSTPGDGGCGLGSPRVQVRMARSSLKSGPLIGFRYINEPCHDLLRITHSGEASPITCLREIG